MGRVVIVRDNVVGNKSEMFFVEKYEEEEGI